jgi:hypothetical protein
MRQVTDDLFQTYINRAWKAQLAVLGADNIPKANVAGNVLRPKTTIRISIRLPPTLPAARAEETLLRLVPECDLPS